MFKRILLASILAMVSVTGIAFGVDGDKTITSKNYVDTLVGTKQAKIPAAGQLGVDAGSTVVTYTSTSGTTGERQLYTDSTSYTAGTDADKLITASALNGAFTNLPTTDTTKLTCANSSAGCTLWNISIQTAYGIDLLAALVGIDGTGYCYKRLSTGEVVAGTCTTQPSNYGDWGVTFPYNGGTVQVNGISVCTDFNTTMDSAYEDNISNAPTENPVGKACYCKVPGSAAGWKRVNEFAGNTAKSECANRCADYCGFFVLQNRNNLRSLLFVGQ